MGPVSLRLGSQSLGFLCPALSTVVVFLCPSWQLQCARGLPGPGGAKWPHSWGCWPVALLQASQTRGGNWVGAWQPSLGSAEGDAGSLQPEVFTVPKGF